MSTTISRNKVNVYEFSLFNHCCYVLGADVLTVRYLFQYISDPILETQQQLDEFMATKLQELEDNEDDNFDKIAQVRLPSVCFVNSNL
jgi:hypothetical protein